MFDRIICQSETHPKETVRVTIKDLYAKMCSIIFLNNSKKINKTGNNQNYLQLRNEKGLNELWNSHNLEHCSLVLNNQECYMY